MMTRKRRNKVLKCAKGYWGAKSLYQFLQGIQKEELHLSTGKYINVT